MGLFIGSNYATHRGFMQMIMKLNIIDYWTYKDYMNFKYPGYSILRAQKFV